MKLHLKAFTLVEILVVIAIIGVLAGIIFPVLSRAKANAKRTEALSNLKQSALALQLYAEDNGEKYPLRNVAINVVPRAVTCDPMDTWRSSCSDDWPPLLGSFGYYVQDDLRMADLTRIQGNGPAVFLMSIFHETPAITAFKGDAPVIGGVVHAEDNFAMPDHVLAARTDSSAARIPVVHFVSGQQLTWSSLFQAVNTRH